MPLATTGVPQTSLDIRNRQGRHRGAGGAVGAARRTQSVPGAAAPVTAAASARGPGPIGTAAPASRISPAAGARRPMIFSVATEAGPGGCGGTGATRAGAPEGTVRRVRLRSIRSSATVGSQSPASPAASSRENRCGASSAWICAGVGRFSAAGRMQARTRSASSTGSPDRSAWSRSSWKTVSTGLAPR